MQLVLDTNIIISAFINPAGNPSQILKMILNRRADFYYNSAIVSEYENVMRRAKFSGKININNIQRFIDLLRNIGTSYDPIPSKIKLADESDRVFYDTAKGSGSFLITGNIKHYPRELFIVSPADFIKRF